jgi:uncharacterized membrane protein YjjB (DUF3815 family)
MLARRPRPRAEPVAERSEAARTRLVSGSAGFTSALQLLENQTVTGVAAAFDTFVTSMSIADGLILGRALTPGRLAHVAPGRVRAEPRTERR